MMGTDIHGIFQRRTSHGWEDIPSNYNLRRHYQLFAVLAGVRNGFGFAGIPMGEVVAPIALPRGLPADFVPDGEVCHPVASLELMGPLAEYHSTGQPLEVWMGDHSHSWLTGSEMLAWAENAPVVTKTGVITREQYHAWDGVSCPDSWAGAVWGEETFVVNDSAVEREKTPWWTHIKIHWHSPLREELAYFFDEVARLVAKYGEVRFVFGFDS